MSEDVSLLTAKCPRSDFYHFRHIVIHLVLRYVMELFCVKNFLTLSELPLWSGLTAPLCNVHTRGTSGDNFTVWQRCGDIATSSLDIWTTDGKGPLGHGELSFWHLDGKTSQVVCCCVLTGTAWHDDDASSSVASHCHLSTDDEAANAQLSIWCHVKRVHGQVW